MASASCTLPRLLFTANLAPSSRPVATFPNRLLSASFRPFPTLSLRSSPTGSPLHRPEPGSPAELAANAPVGNANDISCRSGYNVQIVVGEDEPEEVLLRRFRKEVSRAGVIQECKRRKFFENKQEEKKRKAREAGRRNRRRRFGTRFSSSSSSNASSTPKKVRDDIDDNWEMPEGDLPL